MELSMWTRRQRTGLKDKILRKYFHRCNNWQTTATSLLLKTHTFVLFVARDTMFEKKSFFLWPDKDILWTSGARMINRKKIPLAQNDHKSGISKLGPISPKKTTSRISRFGHFFFIIHQSLEQSCTKIMEHTLIKHGYWTKNKWWQIQKKSQNYLG